MLLNNLPCNMIEHFSHLTLGTEYQDNLQDWSHHTTIVSTANEVLTRSLLCHHGSIRHVKLWNCFRNPVVYFGSHHFRPHHQDQRQRRCAHLQGNMVPVRHHYPRLFRILRSKLYTPVQEEVLTRIFFWILFSLILWETHLWISKLMGI